MPLRLSTKPELTTRWLFARILLPFLLSGAILSVLPLALGVAGTLPGPYDFLNKLTATLGIVLGLAAMLGLLIARQDRAKKITVVFACVSVLFLSLTYLIAADPFSWR